MQNTIKNIKTILSPRPQLPNHDVVLELRQSSSSNNKKTSYSPSVKQSTTYERISLKDNEEQHTSDDNDESADNVHEHFSTKETHYGSFIGGLIFGTLLCLGIYTLFLSNSSSIIQTNTLDKDTTRCDVGWTNNGEYCYKIYEGRVDKYDDAVAKCKSDGANLITIENEEENKFVSSFLHNSNLEERTDVWLGATRLNVDEPYLWTVSSSDDNISQQISFTNWAIDEPKKIAVQSTKIALCAQMYYRSVFPTTSWKWASAACDGNEYDNNQISVCKKHVQKTTKSEPKLINDENSKPDWIIKFDYKPCPKCGSGSMIQQRTVVCGTNKKEYSFNDCDLERFPGSSRTCDATDPCKAENFADDSDQPNIKELKEAFDAFDFNDNGRISSIELHEAIKSLGIEVEIELVEEMIADTDADSNGEISFDEFKKLWDDNFE